MVRMNEPDESITLRIPRKLRKALRVAAASRDVSLSAYVRALIEADLKKKGAAA